MFLLLAGCAETVPCAEGYGRTGSGACVALDDGTEAPTTEDPVDTGATEPSWPFDAAVLDPEPVLGGSLWAGAVLADFDGDGATDLYVPNGLGYQDLLYLNAGDGRFVDAAADWGLTSLEQHEQAAAGDLDNDGDPDLVVGVGCSYGTLDEQGESVRDGDVVVYENTGGSFVETFRFGDLVAGEDYELCPVSLTLVDVDGDGLLDLDVSAGIDPDSAFPWVFQKVLEESEDRLYLSDGALGFVPEHVPFETQLYVDRASVYRYVTFASAWFDLGGDGRADRVAGHGGAFVSVYAWNADELGLDGAYDSLDADFGLWMGLAAADYDADGDLDLYATNQGVSPLMQGYDNLPAEDHTDLTLLAEETGLAAEVVPFQAVFENREGVLVRGDWPLAADHLLAGDLFDGLVDAATGEPVYPQWQVLEDLERIPWSWGAQPLDVDADGWPDVAFASNNCSPPMCIVGDEEAAAGPGGLLRNAEGTGFEDITWSSGVANVDEEGRYRDGRGVSVGDLNGDGYGDFVVASRAYTASESDPLSQQQGTVSVWLSREREGGWLQVEAVGSTSNRDGIGAQVRVDDGQKEVVWGLGVGGNTNGSSEPVATFGVGDAELVDLTVTFPSGATVELADVEVGQRLVVEEP